MAVRVAVCGRAGCARDAFEGTDLCEHHLGLQDQRRDRLRLSEPALPAGALHRTGTPSARSKWETYEGFTGPTVCSAVGISYRQLDYWARTGLVVPSVSIARGSGTRRLYSPTDVALLLLVRLLLDSGQSLQSCRVLLERVRLGVHWPAWAIMSAARVDVGDQLEPLLADAPAVSVVINLARVRDEAFEATA